MRYSTAAFLAQSVIVAALLSCADPGHAQSVRAQPVAEKVDSVTFEQKLNDTRANIGKERTKAPLRDSSPSRIVLDICKKNPKLPQCKL